jgi:hypothetical protein
MRSHVVRGLLAGLLLFSVAPATAQLFRAYLALDGLDTNPCTLQQPCRLLPAAVNAVAGGGEIWMLDSANYNAGPVAITKSVTILAVPGALGSVVALGGAAVVIATPGVNVALRNVHIRPFPGNEAQLGIHMSDGARLMLDGCVVEGFEGGGGHGLVVLALVQSVSAVLESAGNNILRDNASNSSGTVTTVPGTL